MQSQNTPRLVGYARVSTAGQDLALQLDALRAAGCIELHTDTASGSATARPGLTAALDALRPGDVLTVWRLDRLGRSLAHLVSLVSGLEQQGVGFKSLSDAIDTTSPGGRLIFGVMASLAEFERALIAERTRAGVAAAKKRGARLGRRPAITSDQLQHARMLIAAGQSPALVARSMGVGKSTLYRALSTT